MVIKNSLYRFLYRLFFSDWFVFSNEITKTH